jgi:hypothetical protein
VSPYFGWQPSVQENDVELIIEEFPNKMLPPSFKIDSLLSEPKKVEMPEDCQSKLIQELSRIISSFSDQETVNCYEEFDKQYRAGLSESALKEYET